MSSSMLKTLEFSRVPARVKILMFSTHKLACIWYLPKKVFFLTILYSLED